MRGSMCSCGREPRGEWRSRGGAIAMASNGNGSELSQLNVPHLIVETNNRKPRILLSFLASQQRLAGGAHGGRSNATKVRKSGSPSCIKGAHMCYARSLGSVFFASLPISRMFDSHIRRTGEMVDFHQAYWAVQTCNSL